MIELSRHIESLMLKHDCVIVPGLGGFITQYVPARRVEGEQLFLPPCRTVGFNQQLTLNDGLLVQSYMQAYDTNYPETIKLINDAVKQLKQELQENGEYELSGIGRLTLGIGGKYNFTPCEAGVLSPELYGLDTVSIPNVAQAEKQKPAIAAHDKKKVHIKRTEKNYTISINRELVNYVAAAVVTIFFYFLWATPVSNSPQNDKQAASAIYEQLFDNATQKVVQPQEAKSVQPAVQPQAESAATANNTTPTAKTMPTQVGRYTLVLASAISEGNAQHFAQKLKQEGMKDASAYKRGRMVRVVYGHYANENEAQKALNTLRRHEAFTDAWVMEIK
ncbi:MAG: SPOR domain-containing protein [Bacteroidales bacterium]